MNKGGTSVATAQAGVREHGLELWGMQDVASPPEPLQAFRDQSNAFRSPAMLDSKPAHHLAGARSKIP